MWEGQFASEVGEWNIWVGTSVHTPKNTVYPVFSQVVSLEYEMRELLPSRLAYNPEARGKVAETSRGTKYHTYIKCRNDGQ